eukprot:snap_masked-scaffold_3-processed-gene-4.8-mRNA-1 protein AED:1.00 eAED:1.00 QI:0/-1/0/0/-1/1/1/0/355
MIAQLGKYSTCGKVREVFEKTEPELIELFRNSTTIITGSTSGLGKKTAQHIAYLGGYVILGCRNVEKGDQVVDEIIRSPERKQYGLSEKEIREKVFGVQLDLSSLESVKTFVEKCEERANYLSLPPLKCLILNAGLFNFHGKKSTEDIELTFAVNHLGHFLLTKLLMKHLRISEEERQPGKKVLPSKVIVLASESAKGHLITKNISSKEEIMQKLVFPKELRSEFQYVSAHYANTKLFNVLFSQRLNEIEGKNGVVSCSLHPGSKIGTEISTGGSFLFSFFFKHIVGYFSKTIDQGCSTTLSCALSSAERVAGKYFSDCQEFEPPKLAADMESNLRRKVLWEISENLCAKYSNLF